MNAAERARALTDRLVGISSVSPDARGERACAAAIESALPRVVERGAWELPDGRPVLWARARGASQRALLLLAHYDTVGVAEYETLGHDLGSQVAFHPDALRDLLLRLEPSGLPSELAADLEEERRRPGTWRFGRGMLDMKSGLAAGVVALEALAAAPGPGTVVLLACPDEENRSAGMLEAVTRFQELEPRAAWVGALNLDYVESPGAYEGLAGKLLVGLWVLGMPAHAADPFRGWDATQMAAALVTRLTTSERLLERFEGAPSVPPVALRLRDLKTRYDVQTAIEAEVALNLLVRERDTGGTIETLRSECAAALEDLARRLAALSDGRMIRVPDLARRVLTFPELLARAGVEEERVTGEPADLAAPTFERARRLARRAGLVGPWVVIALLPPYYPRAMPRTGGLADRLRPLLESRGAPLKAYYPYISDACYLACEEPIETVGSHLPALGREYWLPIESCRSLDLEVVTLGPWGRDAHGLFERVNAPYAHGALPGLIEEAARAALDDSAPIRRIQST